MFESCWAHHSTRLHLASGEPKARSWRAIRLVECPERAKRVEGPHASWRAIRLVECPERTSGTPQACGE
jgi:hypothetical protein